MVPENAVEYLRHLNSIDSRGYYESIVDFRVRFTTILMVIFDHAKKM